MRKDFKSNFVFDSKNKEIAVECENLSQIVGFSQSDQRPRQLNPSERPGIFPSVRLFFEFQIQLANSAARHLFGRNPKERFARSSLAIRRENTSLR